MSSRRSATKLAANINQHNEWNTLIKDINTKYGHIGSLNLLKFNSLVNKTFGRAVAAPVKLLILQQLTNYGYKVGYNQTKMFEQTFALQSDPFIANTGIVLLKQTGWHVTAGMRLLMRLHQDDICAAYNIYVTRVLGKEAHYWNEGLHFQLMNALLNSYDGEEAFVVYKDALRRGYVVDKSKLARVLEICILKRDYESILDIKTFEQTKFDRSILELLSVEQLQAVVNLGTVNNDISMVHSAMALLMQKTGTITSQLVSCIGQLTQRDGISTIQLLTHLKPNLTLEDVPLLSFESFDRNVDLSKYPTELQTLVMNCRIRAAYHDKTPTFAFQQYQLHRSNGVIPDNQTLQLLASSAYRLGNAKKLSYLIFKDCMKFDIKPTRRTFESFLRISLTGKKFDSIFYWLKYMRLHQVKLRDHLHWNIKKRFDKIKDDQYVNILKQTSLLEYYNFPTDEQLQESSTRGGETMLSYHAESDFKNCHDWSTQWNNDYVGQ